MSFSSIDEAHMRAALALGRRGHGNVWPNPAVGCVIISKNGDVVGRGWTQPGGRPHAETVALAAAGEQAQGGTAYVTLEPCSHYGKTPPCAKALIESKIAKVIVATTDPDARVSGRGIEMLRHAGIHVEIGLCKEEADHDNAGFFSRITQNKPYITLKVATTLDGYIAAQNGASKWITGPLARQRGHLLRSQHDAILIGSGTLTADNPSLTTRFNGASQLDQPLPIILDSHLKTLKEEYALYENEANHISTWVLHICDLEEEKIKKLKRPNIELVKVQQKNGHVDFEAAMNVLAEKGITRLLIEGGSQIAASALKTGLVDEIYWFRAASIMGGDGVSAIAPMNIVDLIQMPKFKLEQHYALEKDILTIYKKL